MMKLDRKKILSLSGAVALAGVVIVGGIYGPTAWKVLRGQVNMIPSEQVILQTPPVNSSGQTEMLPQDNNTGGQTNNSSSVQPQGSTSTPTDQKGSKKYTEPDISLINPAPSIVGYFGTNALSDAAKTLAFGIAWNLHQYADGYLGGATAGPQMNSADIKKYIIFHKTLWEKQMEKETKLSQAATFDTYMRNLMNRGIDAFDSNDKVRIEQFHQEIHDMDTHIFRDDLGSKIYGATPFATKRTQ